MSRRRRVELAPMLFPFLDVLVCTMGTLILLLPLVTKKVSEHVQTAAEAEVHKELAVAEEDADWRAEQLLKIREKQTQELERRRGQLAHVEEHLQRLDKQLRKLTDEMIAAASNVDVEKLRTEVEQLRAKEAQLRMEIQQKEAEQVSGPPRFVILPYRGNNGTQRRPVYIECTADKIVIQPENIVIDAQVLKGPLGPGNPLDAALRAIRLHWQTIEPEPPYPLLVVRPDGVLAYAVARTAMTAWDDQFGYELVPDGVDLVFGDPDAVLRQKIQVAINDAVERRDEMIAAMPGRYRSTGTSQMDRSMAAASAAARVGNDPLDPLQRWQAAGEQSARQQPGGNGGTNKTASGGTSNAGSSAGGYGGSSGELMPLEGDFTPAPAGSEDSFAMNGRGGAPGGGVPGNGQLGGYGSAPSLMSQNQWQSGQGPVGNSMLGTGPGSTGGTPSMLGAGAANNTGMGSGLTGTQAGPGSQPQSSATGFNAAAAGSELNPATGNGTSGEASQGNRPQSGNTNKIASNGGKAGNGSSTEGQSKSEGNSPGATGSKTPFSQDQAGQGGSMMSTGGFADPNAGATPGGPQQAQAYQDEGSQAKNAASAPPLSRQRGKNWAVPENAQRPGPTVVRQIAVKAYPAHYELRTSKGQVLTFPIDPRKPELSVLQLATAAREQISSWGPSISGGRWQPQLSVQVQPRAEGAYAALANLLEGSGLEVQRSGAR